MLCQLFNDKRVMIVISCNPLVELKIILLLFRGVLFCEIVFDLLLSPLSEDLEALLLVGLLNTCSETE